MFSWIVAWICRPKFHSRGQSAYFQLHNIAKIRYCLTVNACKTTVHALVTSKLDYGNAVLFGINERLINKLQMTQKSAARLIMRQRRRDHITVHTCPDCTALATTQISNTAQSAGVNVTSSPQYGVSVHH